MSKKQTLLEAAISLFSEKGYNGTSTSEIVEKAGVAQGTLFYHFKNKEGILLCVLETVLNDYLDAVGGIARGRRNGLETLEQIARSSILFRRQRSQELLVLMRDFPADLIAPESSQMAFIVQFFTRLQKIFRDCLEKGQADGSIRPLDPEKYSHILLGMLAGIDRHILLDPVPCPELTEEVIDFIHRGLSTSESESLPGERST